MATATDPRASEPTGSPRKGGDTGAAAGGQSTGNRGTASPRPPTEAEIREALRLRMELWPADNPRDQLREAITGYGDFLRSPAYDVLESPDEPSDVDGPADIWADLRPSEARDLREAYEAATSIALDGRGGPDRRSHGEGRAPVHPTASPRATRAGPGGVRPVHRRQSQPTNGPVRGQIGDVSRIKHPPHRPDGLARRSQSLVSAAYRRHRLVAASA
jgi:hypothetical protein